MTSNAASDYTIPDIYANLSELASPAPVENPKEQDLYRHQSLEETRTLEQAYMRHKRNVEGHRALVDPSGQQTVSATKTRRVSCFTFWTHLRNRVLRH
jgi:hypothetical protein